MPKPVDLQQAKQVSIIIAVCTVAVNVAFFFLADVYYKDRIAMHGPTRPDEILATKKWFGVMTGMVMAAAIGGQFFPRSMAHTLAGMVGALALVAGVMTINAPYPSVLPVSLLVIGGTLLALIYLSVALRSRAAWAFLTAICAIGGVVMLFGSTKVRNALDISLYQALIVPGLLGVAAVLFVMIGDDYAEV